jgi:hypothetical protein
VPEAPSGMRRLHEPRGHLVVVDFGKYRPQLQSGFETERHAYSHQMLVRQRYLQTNYAGHSNRVGVQGFSFWLLRCVTGEDIVAIFRRLVAGEAGLVQRLVARLAVLKVNEPQPPVAAYFFESLTMNCIFTGTRSRTIECRGMGHQGPCCCLPTEREPNESRQ